MSILSGIDWLMVLFAIFVFTQSLYALLNLVTIYLHMLPVHVIEKEIPEKEKKINAIIPAYKERKEVLETSLESIYSADYPNSLLNVYYVIEEEDEETPEAIQELREKFSEIDIDTITVLKGSEAWQKMCEHWDSKESTIPSTKARALTYSMHELDFEGVITVFDADTLVSPDLFNRAVAGLEEYDIVQAKQSVYNVWDGFLPLQESFGITAWSSIIYPRISDLPYQLLGKGYFIHSESLYELGGWKPSSITEDMDLGLRGYMSGHELGIIDTFVYDLVPVKLGDWLGQKRRWLTGPYNHLRGVDRIPSVKDRFEFILYTGVPQTTSFANLLGIPAGILVFVLSVVNGGFLFSDALIMIVSFNGLIWGAYSYKSYIAVRDAAQIDEFEDTWLYYVLANPLTQLVYAILWTPPLFLALIDALSDKELDFDVTEK